LEPNGANLEEIFIELFRVTIDRLVLFEPCFEINSEAGKRRMERLGYIKNIDSVVEKLGGAVIEKISIRNITNPLNPTVCFVIAPPVCGTTSANIFNTEGRFFSVPGTSIPLQEFENYHFSNQVGMCYPKLRSIPVLRSSVAILASSICD
jgi:hypothetical protein